MDAFPVDDDGLIRLDTTRSLGFNDRELQRACERGELDRVGPGVYAAPADRTPEERHRLTVLAASTTNDVVISHSSAAVVHRLPMLGPDLSRVHITSATTDRGYRRGHRYLHPGWLAPADVVQIDGVWVTVIERTAFDVARSSPHGFAGALAVFDAALRAGADRDRMAGYARRPQTGVAVARRALLYADPLSENPGESLGRAQMIEAGLPMPRLQCEIYDIDGDFVGRPDYEWRDGSGRRVVGEFDGVGKYLKYLSAGESAETAIRREKEREGRLQDLGVIVVRWTWRELQRRRMVPRVRAQLLAVGMIESSDPANPAA
ncbi:type IV toxin-antitoxin system AbiEi family antitoxin domain-containing protein [Jongsikchunia kroppenstedtii]|uniref:type IV toxin-antitoxin system AbiEi family antitoxin domain-containing protein n=1 Tax=Jongsikchunia kroppenstedtii TaxID=1121721 RepID=UPI000379D461|nr:hypothetical protein [Jongsikchunia kroppenstedtii]